MILWQQYRGWVIALLLWGMVLGYIWWEWVSYEPNVTIKFSATRTIEAFSIIGPNDLRIEHAQSGSIQAPETATSLLNQGATVAITATTTLPSLTTHQDQELQPLLCRVALHRIEAGAEVTSTDLGPQVSFSSPYRTLTLRAITPLHQIYVGDTVRLVLVPFPTEPSSPRPSPSASDTGLSGLERGMLTNTLILHTGEPQPDGTIQLIVAVPMDGENFEILDHLTGSVVAYPLYSSQETPLPNSSPVACNR